MHYLKFVRAISGAKGSLPFVVFSDVHEVVGSMEVDSQIPVGGSEMIKQIIGKSETIDSLDCDVEHRCIECLKHDLCHLLLVGLCN